MRNVDGIQINKVYEMVLNNQLLQSNVYQGDNGTNKLTWNIVKL